MAPAIKQGLSSAGFVHNFPKDVRHGTVRYQGLAIPDIYVSMNEAKLKYVLYFGTYRHGPGELLRHVLEGLQLEAGSERLILNQDFKSLILSQQNHGTHLFGDA